MTQYNKNDAGNVKNIGNEESDINDDDKSHKNLDPDPKEILANRNMECCTLKPAQRCLGRT